MDPVPPDRLLKPGETAERLAISLRTLDSLHDLGLLAKVPVLRSVRYRESDVARLIREGAVAPDRRAA